MILRWSPTVCRSPGGALLGSRWLLPTALAGWLAAVVTAGLLSVQWRMAQDQARLEEDGRATQRLLSQRADQHDAHFTSLGTLVASWPATARPLEEVAAGILRFYPRITAIDVAGTAGELRFTTRPACDGACATALAAAATAAREGVPTVMPHTSGRYLMAKRAGVLAVLVEVDAARLLEGAPLVPTDGVSLRLPGGRVLLARPAAEEGLMSLRLAFDAELGSTSQPFPLHLERRPSSFALVPWPMLGAFALVVATLGGLVLGLLRSWQVAHEAGRRALLGEQTVRPSRRPTDRRGSAVSDMGPAFQRGKEPRAGRARRGKEEQVGISASDGPGKGAASG